LYFASIGGHTALVKLLLEAKANPDIAKCNGLFNLHLHICRRRRVSPISISLGASPLYVACEWGAQEIVQILLTAGADANLRCTTCDYDTAVVRSVVNNRPQVLDVHHFLFALESGIIPDGHLSHYVDFTAVWLFGECDEH